MLNINTTENITKKLTDSEIDSALKDIANRLSSQKKFTIALPIIEGKPSTAEICYNGYVFRIQCGVQVEVPEPVYLLLKQSGRLGI